MLIEKTNFWKNKRNNSSAKINWKFDSPNAIQPFVFTVILSYVIP